MLDLEIYIDKIAESGRRTIRKAFEEAVTCNYNQIAPEHILLAIANVDGGLFAKVMQSLNLDPQTVLRPLERPMDEHYLDEHQYSRRRNVIRMSDSFRTLLANGWKSAQLHHRLNIELEDLFIALFQNEESSIVKLFQQVGASRKMIIQEIQNHASNLKSDSAAS